jgi:methionine sulfoxide reductase heme-binding subunit
MSDQILWFVARGSGVVSLLLSTAVVCLGLLTVVRWHSPSWPRFLTTEVHRTTALLSLAFLGVHIATAVLDPFTSLGLVAAVVPFASSYRPVAVGLGVVATDLVLALVITSLLRDRLGHRAWRAVHWLAYGAWPLAVVHGFTAGSDAFAPWMLAIEIACVVAVVLALAWRATAGSSPRPSLEAIASRGNERAGSARGGR